MKTTTDGIMMVEQESIVKVGRSGEKTHVAIVTYSVKGNMRRLVGCRTRCKAGWSGPGWGRTNPTVQVVASTNDGSATCKWCNPK